jgi:hypothetical protein
MVDRPAWSREVFFAFVSVLGLSRQSIAFSSSFNAIGLELYRPHEKIILILSPYDRAKGPIHETAPLGAWQHPFTV